MKILIVTLLCCVVLICGCLNNNPCGYAPIDGFQAGYFYYSDNRKIPLLLCLDVVSVKFNNDVSLDEATELLSSFELSLFSDYYDEFYDPVNWSDLFEEKYLIMQLPSGAKLDDFLTHYPKTSERNSFGNHPMIKFCIPSYAFPTYPDSIGSRVFMGDEISVKTSKDSSLVSDCITQYGLEIIEKKNYGCYLLRITQSSQMNTLDMANHLYEGEFFDYSLPNFIAMIELDGR
jgi:hypothetical protein